jgi:hypothetical protein
VRRYVENFFKRPAENNNIFLHVFGNVTSTQEAIIACWLWAVAQYSTRGLRWLTTRDIAFVRYINSPRLVCLEICTIGKTLSRFLSGNPCCATRILKIIMYILLCYFGLHVKWVLLLDKIYRYKWQVNLSSNFWNRLFRSCYGLFWLINLEHKAAHGSHVIDPRITSRMKVGVSPFRRIVRP